MKDIVITGKTIKRELIVFACCLVASECCNLYAVIRYSRPALELISQIGFVILLALIIYVVAWLVKIVISLIRKLIKH